MGPAAHCGLLYADSMRCKNAAKRKNIPGDDWKSLPIKIWYTCTNESSKYGCSLRSNAYFLIVCVCFLSHLLVVPVIIFCEISCVSFVVIICSDGVKSGESIPFPSPQCLAFSLPLKSDHSPSSMIIAQVHREAIA